MRYFLYILLGFSTVSWDVVLVAPIRRISLRCGMCSHFRGHGDFLDFRRLVGRFGHFRSKPFLIGFSFTLLYISLVEASHALEKFTPACIQKR